MLTTEPLKAAVSTLRSEIICRARLVAELAVPSYWIATRAASKAATVAVSLSNIALQSCTVPNVMRIIVGRMIAHSVAAMPRRDTKGRAFLYGTKAEDIFVSLFCREGNKRETRYGTLAFSRRKSTNFRSQHSHRGYLKTTNLAVVDEMQQI